MSMTEAALSSAQVEEIALFQRLGRLPLQPCFIEKDLLVTKLVHHICGVGRAHGARMIFCGGTALSQAWNLIGRMSEDADFRIVLPDGLNTSRQRRLLSSLKQDVLVALEGNGYLPDGNLQARNNNGYITGYFRYASRFPLDAALRPTIKIEITAFDPASEIADRPLQSILDKVAGRAPGAEHPRVPVVSVQDTLADKLVSYLRRTAAHRAGCGPGIYDDRLVRHLYDVHQIVTKRPDVITRLGVLFPHVVSRDQTSYGNQFPAFRDNAKEVLQNEIEHLDDAVTRDRYELFVRDMVYAETPTFTDVIRTFRAVIQLSLDSLDENPDFSSEGDVTPYP